MDRKLVKNSLKPTELRKELFREKNEHVKINREENVNLLKKAGKIEKMLILVFSFLLFLLTDISIIARAFFTPVVWSIDISRFLYIWLIFIAVYVALKDDEHVRIEVILDILRKKYKKDILNKITKIRNIVCIIFFIILSIFSFEYVYIYKIGNVRTISINFPYFLFPLAISLSSVCSSVWLIWKTFIKEKGTD